MARHELRKSSSSGTVIVGSRRNRAFCDAPASTRQVTKGPIAMDDCDGGPKDGTLVAELVPRVSEAR